MSRFITGIGPRIATVAVWGAVAVSLWYWTQVNIAESVPAPPDTPRTAPKVEASGLVAVARLLGARPLTTAGPLPATADRFVLSGVVASSTGQGAALISVDGTAARPFRVGAELAPGFVLVAVARREAMLADGLNAPVRVVLTLPLSTSAQALTTTPAAAAGVATAPAAAEASSVAPGVVQQVPESPAVPARADARRQPQTSLRRDEQRTP